MIAHCGDPLAESAGFAGAPPRRGRLGRAPWAGRRAGLEEVRRVGYARHLTVPQDEGGIFHCFSRCVRRERLLDAPDRPELLERRLAFLSTKVFAVDLIEFKTMGNHVHVIVRTHPELTWCWTAEEVARRWLRLSLAGRRPDLDEGEEPGDAAVAALAADAPRIEELRRRLADLGSYHSAWKEWAAKRWNREDRVSGHFWEGRYGLTTPLDEGAVLSQSAYVLLNAVHAGLEPELGIGTPGSLRTRIRRLMREIGQRAERDSEFDRDFVHASWTPVYPCDPGSARELDDEEYAKRVAAGRHRASFRAALREEARELSRLSRDGEADEVERLARELRDQGGAGEAGTATASEPKPVRRRRPRNVPRHRSRREADAAPWTRLRRDESAWRTGRPNPFSPTRLVRGAVPVMPGVTLGTFIAFTHEEGMHPRPDKRGSIAPDAEHALVSLRQLVTAAGPDGRLNGRRTDPAPGEPVIGPGVPDPPAIAAARRLAAAMRDGLAALLARARGRAGGCEGAAAGPLPVRHRGTAIGSEESLRNEALRRRGTCVHSARATLRE